MELSSLLLAGTEEVAGVVELEVVAVVVVVELEVAVAVVAVAVVAVAVEEVVAWDSSSEDEPFLALLMV